MKHNLKIIVLTVLMNFNIHASPKDVITFEGGTQVITKSTSCAPEKWGNNVINSCLCCIVKTAPLGSIGISLERKILESCKKYCSNETLKNISTTLNASSDDFKGIVPKILKSNSVLHYIDMSGEYLGKNGQLDEETVGVLLKKATEQGYIRDATYTVKQLGKGGAQTLQLFMILESGKPKYILKEMKQGYSEVKNLQIIKQSRLKDFIFNPDKVVKRIPALAMDEQNFIYTYKGQNHNLSLLDIAGGNSFGDIVFDWTKDPLNQVKKDRATKALYRLGQNLALIHSAYMVPKGGILGKTYVHGDLHPYNIFYDDVNDRIIFIDNETFALSVAKPRDASLDIMKLYGRLTATRFEKRHAYLQKGNSEQDYYNTLIKPFILGYLSIYPKQKETAIQMLYKLMTGQNALKTYLDNEKTFLNPVELYRSQQVYMKPLFVDIAKEQGLQLNAPAKISLLGRLLK